MIFNFKNLLSIFLSCILLIIVFFYPTSSNSVIYSALEIIVFYFIVTILLISSLLFIKINKINLILAFFLFVALSLSSLISILSLSAELSIARIAIVLMSLFIFASNFQINKNFSYFFRIIFHFITIITIVSNLFFLAGDTYIEEFLIKNFSQFFFYTVPSQLSQGKPVFTFGVHTFASYFYFLIIYFWFISFKLSSKKFIYFLYILFFLLFIILLDSYSAYVLFFLSLLMVLSLFISEIRYVLYFKLFIMILPFLFLIILLFYNEEIQSIFFDDSHGIFPRYFGGLFSINFEVIGKTIFGIGFTIPRNFNIVYTDSGPIVYHTMGVIYFPVVFYILFYRFLKVNLKSNFLFLFLITLLFELAIPALIFLKSILLIYLVTQYQFNLTNEKK
jgi:hypothetical protein